MNALHGKCHTLEERQPSGARFPLICMFVFRSAPVLYRGVRDAIVFLRALFFGRLSFDDRSLFYARLLFGLLLPYAQSFQRVAYYAARACFPMCALDPGVDLWWSRSVIAYFWARLFSGRLSLIKIRSRLILELSEWSLFRGAHLLAGMYVCFGGCLSPLIGSHLVITRFMVSVRYPLCKFGFMIGIRPL